MRVLVDMVHPADALFFHHAINRLTRAGADVRIASRGKDVLTDLLDELGHRHIPLTNARRGLAGQACELIQRDLALFAMARRWRPDVMTGFGGVAISHVGSILGIPSVGFYDTEHASLQIGLTLPFISEWHVPERWTGRVSEGRTFRFPGAKQFAYLHPDHFRPDREIARSAGWDPARDNFLVRTVAWQANHDHGRRGISVERLRALVANLATRGKVHISAEGGLPSDLEPLRAGGGPAAFHHLLAHCRLCCGESITVASEAVSLGVPALLQIDKEYGYVAAQEQYGLIERLTPRCDIGTRIDAVLNWDPEAYRARAREFALASGDLTAHIVEALSRASRSARTGRPERAPA